MHIPLIVLSSIFLQTITASQRSRLLARNQAMSRTSESIARSQRVAAETDDIGHNIIGELGSQREQLTRTRDRVSFLITHTYSDVNM